MAIKRYKMQILNSDDVHWPVGHPLSCGIAGRTAGEPGVALSCLRCIENTAQDLRRVQQVRTLRPKHALPRAGNYYIQPIPGQLDKTDGFRVGKESLTRTGKKSKRPYHVFRSDGCGNLDFIFTSSHNPWLTDDCDTAEAFAQYLNTLRVERTDSKTRRSRSRKTRSKKRKK